MTDSQQLTYVVSPTTVLRSHSYVCHGMCNKNNKYNRNNKKKQNKHPSNPPIWSSTSSVAPFSQISSGSKTKLCHSQENLHETHNHVCQGRNMIGEMWQDALGISLETFEEYNWESTCPLLAPNTASSLPLLVNNHSWTKARRLTMTRNGTPCAIPALLGVQYPLCFSPFPSPVSPIVHL